MSKTHTRRTILIGTGLLLAQLPLPATTMHLAFGGMWNGSYVSARPRREAPSRHHRHLSGLHRLPRPRRRYRLPPRHRWRYEAQAAWNWRARG